MRKTFFRFGQWLAQRRQLAQVRDRRRRSAGATWTGLEALEDRAMLSAGPTIGSVTASPTVVTRGDSITLTANNISDLGAAVKSVVFYLDANNDGFLDTGDRNLGSGKLVAGTANYSKTVKTGKFSVSDNSVTDVTVNNKVFAVVTDTAKNKAVGTSAAITVDSKPPTIGKLVLQNTPAVAAGNALNFKALDVQAHDGTVLTQVSFYYDANNDGVQENSDPLLGTDTGWPGGWTLATNAPATLPTTGTVHFFAVATDSDGTTSDTKVLTVKVDAPPVISSLTANPTTTTRGTATNVTLTAAVSDSDGTIKKVNFYFDSNSNGIFDVGDKLLGPSTLTNGSFTATGTVPANLTSGTATFFAVAQDNKGVTSTLSTVTVNVTPPSIGTLTTSVPIVERGSTIVLTASNVVASANQTISSVQFFIDTNNNGVFDAADTSIGSVTTPTNSNYAFTYSVPATAATGNTTFFAVAKDTGNNSSPAVSVQATIGPAIGSFTTDVSTVAIGSSVTFSASGVVAASGSSISAVKFYLDTNGNGVFDAATDTPLGQGTLNNGVYSLPFTVTSTIPTGSDTFFAVASDNATTPITSSASSVKVTVTPKVASLTATAPTVGINKPMTLTASGVVTSATKTIASVQFFFDTNNNGVFDSGTDAILGNGSLVNGNYQLTFNVPSSIPTGSGNFFAVATDSTGVKSPAAILLNESIVPSIATLAANPTSVAAGGSTVITASGVLTSNGRTISGVEFFLDDNNNGILDAGETDLGPGVLMPGQNYQFTYHVPGTATAGPETIFAVAKDSNNSSSLPANVTITVTAPTT